MTETKPSKEPTKKISTEEKPTLNTSDQPKGQLIIKKKTPKEKKSKTSPPSKGLDMKTFGEQQTQKKELSGFDMEDYNTPEEEIQATETIITAINVGRPDNQMFFMTHPVMFTEVNVIEYTEEKGKVYLVHKDAIPYVAGYTKKMKLYPIMSLKGNIWLFPVTQPKPGKKMHEWHASREKVIFHARKHWVQCKPKSEGTGYDAIVALKKHEAPEWPELTMPELLEIAFDGYIIKDKDHPVIKSLRGE